MQSFCLGKYYTPNEWSLEKVLTILTMHSAVVQSFFGQLADVFGRRWPLIFSVAMFTLGSGIAGGSTSAGMLIGGRVLQGIGLGGVNMLLDIIISDLVPQRKRGAIMGIVFAIFALGSSLGPFHRWRTRRSYFLALGFLYCVTSIWPGLGASLALPAG
jgi:MFS family permease